MFIFDTNVFLEQLEIITLFMLEEQFFWKLITVCIENKDLRLSLTNSYEIHN